MSNPRKVVAVVQARMTSKRLPGKTLFPLGNEAEGLTVIDWVMQRVERFTFVDQAVVLVENEHAEHPLREHLLSRRHDFLTILNMKKFDDGSNNMLNAYVDAIYSTGATDVVRVTGDCPFVSPCLAEQVWFHYKNRNEYTSNVTVPGITGMQDLDGFDIEIMPAQALIERNKDHHLSEYERHHVTPRLRIDAKSWYVPQRYVHDRKLSLDTMQDYLYLYRIASAIKIDTEWPEIIRLADQWSWRAR